MRIPTRSIAAAFAGAIVMVSSSHQALVDAVIAGSGSLDLRGITPDVQHKLASATSFVCDDGSKRYPLARLNDNYCDCQDGSDEPGTPACSHTHARFHCTNHGFISSNIPTSHVNDHVCDCCDGSDEYDSGVSCPNTCTTLMAARTAATSELMATYEQGRVAREALVALSTQQFDADANARSTKQAEVAELKDSLARLREQREEEERYELEERLARTRATKQELVVALGLDELSHEQLAFMVLELAQLVTGSDKDDDNKSGDALLRLIRMEREANALGSSPVAAQEREWRVREQARVKEVARIDKAREERAEAKAAAQVKALQEQAQAQEDGEEREAIIEAPEEEEEQEQEEQEEEEEEEEEKYPEEEERPLSVLLAKMSTLGDYIRPEAQEVRDSLKDAEKKLSSAEKEVKELDKTLDAAYGDANALYALRNECFTTSPGGAYLYQICLFASAKQDSTSLGKMQPYDPARPNELSFTKGTSCWNGPQRSLTVTMECGVEPELYSVDEPSTCVYTARFKTPLACVEGYKDELLRGGDTEEGGAHHIATAHHVEIEVDAVP